MSTRLEFNGTTLRLFVSREAAQSVAASFQPEKWVAVEFEFGWLLRNPIGAVHDAYGPVPEQVASEINQRIGA